MIGTTRFMSDAAGSKVEASVYTAFGERIDGSNHRYGYAGAWGYQAHDEMPFLHVGARYYDPATGRFLQRDPMGIMGGLNVYAYAWAAPTAFIDPEGGYPRGALEMHHAYRGLRQMGKTPSEASQMMREGAAFEAKVVAVGFGTVITAAAIYASAPYVAQGVAYGLRYLPARYTGYALDRMYQWGMTGSVVTNAIRHGSRTAGNRPGRSVFRYENVVVVTDCLNKVITMWKTSH